MKTQPASTSSTVEPLAEGVASATSPEFLPADGITRIFGVSRSSLYRLQAEGAIHSVLLRRRGMKSGRRLYAVDTIRALLREEMAKQAEGARA